MARSYRNVRPKSKLVYATDDVVSIYNIHPNTITNWTKAGLRAVDQKQPLLFRGDELIWFHIQRALDTKRKLHVGQFKCFTCKLLVFPEPEGLRFEDTSNSYSWVSADCPACCGRMIKFINETNCETLRACVESNTNLQSIDEDDVVAPVGIVKVGHFQRPIWVTENERILYQYQLYAKRFDPKTVDAMFASIRDFEKFCDKKRFSKLTLSLVSAYRSELTAPAHGENAKLLRRSTIAHRASHIRAFLKWLVQQDGYRRLNKSLCDYIFLSKRETAKTLQPLPREIPTEDQVRKMVQSMPTVHRMQRRDRAIVAASFLFGTRTDTTASLRVCDINCENRRVSIDATLVRVKNSKSQTISWFPIGTHFEEIICDWINELLEVGAKPEDALFPPDCALAARTHLVRSQGKPIEPWKTDQAIRHAFRRASQCACVPYYTPHSAKHFLARLQDKHCRTVEHRKAWSFNLGHENIQITDSNYAKMTSENRDGIFANMYSGDFMIDDDKDLLLALYEHKLSPGTLEFERARKLQIERLGQ